MAIVKSEGLSPIKIKQEYPEEELMLPPGNWGVVKEEPKKNLTLDGLRYLLQNCMILKKKFKVEPGLIIGDSEGKENLEIGTDFDGGSENVEGKKSECDDKTDNECGMQSGKVDSRQEVKCDLDVEVVTLTDSPVKEAEGAEHNPILVSNTETPTIPEPPPTFIPIRFCNVAWQFIRSPPPVPDNQLRQVPIKQSMSSNSSFDSGIQSPVKKRRVTRDGVEIEGLSKIKDENTNTKAVKKSNKGRKRKIRADPTPSQTLRWGLKDCRVSLFRFDDLFKIEKGPKSGIRFVNKKDDALIRKTVRGISQEKAFNISKKMGGDPTDPLQDKKTRLRQCEICFHLFPSPAHLRRHMRNLTPCKTPKMRNNPGNFGTRRFVGIRASSISPI